MRGDDSESGEDECSSWHSCTRCNGCMLTRVGEYNVILKRSFVFLPQAHYATLFIPWCTVQVRPLHSVTRCIPITVYQGMRQCHRRGCPGSVYFRPVLLVYGSCKVLG